MALFGLYKSAEQRRNERLMDKWSDRAGDYRKMVDSVLGDIGQRSDQAYQSAQQTTRQRFGNELQTVTDRLRQNQEASRTNLNRAMMARGGGQQGVGQMGTTMNQQQEGMNKSVQNSLQQFYQMNQQAKQQDLNRADQLLGQQFSGARGQFQTSQGLSQNYAQLERQRKQANKQMLADAVGAASSFFGG